MHDREPFPPAKDSATRLHRSGWSAGEAVFTGTSGRVLHQLNGTNGEYRIKVVGATSRQA